MRVRRFDWMLRGVAAVALVALTATTAAAGGKTPPPPPPPSSPQCGANPNPVMNGYGYNLVGLGFAAGMGVTVYVADQTATWTYQGVVASNGTFSIPATAKFSVTGTKNVYVNKTGDRKMITYCKGQFSAL